MDSSKLGRQVEETQPEVEEPKPPLCSIMEELFSENFNVGASIFETKGGVRAALLGLGSGTDAGAFDRLVDLPLVKRAKANILKQLRNSDTCVVNFETKDSARKVLQKLQSLASPELFTRMLLPRTNDHNHWSFKVYGPQLWGSKTSAVSVGWSRMGLMEAYLILEGDAHMAGIQTDKIPGETFKDRRNIPYRSTIDNIRGFEQDRGFYVAFKDGKTADGKSIVVVPSGFMTITSMSNCRFIKWALSSDDNDLARVKWTLQGMMDSYPELKTDKLGIAAFATYLELRL